MTATPVSKLSRDELEERVRNAENDNRLADSLDAFTASRSAIEAVVNLIHADQKAEREAARRRRRRNWILGSIGAVVVVVAVVLTVRWLAGISQSTGTTSRGNNELLRKFDDCINPGTTTHPHRCYDRSQAQTAAAIGSIVDSSRRATAYSFECVLAGRVDVDACVAERFAGAPRPAPITHDAPTEPPASQTATTTTGTTTTTSVLQPTPPPPPSPPTQPVPTPAPPPPPVQATPTPTIPPCDLNLSLFCVNQPRQRCGSMLCLPQITPAPP